MLKPDRASYGQLRPQPGHKKRGGQTSQPATLSQLEILGNFAYKVYVDCLGANLELCQQLGIEQVPTIFYSDMIYTGTKDLQWFEDTTGCRMG